MTTECHMFSDHLHEAPRVDVFVKNWWRFYYTSKIFSDNPHNLKSFVDSKKHDWKFRNYSSEKHTSF